MIANPTAIPFEQRKGTAWLEQLRSIRLIPPIKKSSRKAGRKKDENLIENILAKLSPEQLKGYLSGLK